MARAQESDDFVADINVTPFVDVMLVLLVIFMVTAPMMTEGLDLELPKVEATEILPTENDHMILSVKADGSLFLDEYPTTLADLESLLQHTVIAPGRQLFLRADKLVPYGTVLEVMGRVRAVGITDLGMVAEPLTGAVAPDSTLPDSAAAGPAETGPAAPNLAAPGAAVPNSSAPDPAVSGPAVFGPAASPGGAEASPVGAAPEVQSAAPGVAPKNAIPGSQPLAVGGTPASTASGSQPATPSAVLVSVATAPAMLPASGTAPVRE